MTDQEVAARIVVTPVGGVGTFGQTAGVVARYVDSSNYIRAAGRLTLETVQQFEIVKVVAGVETILASATGAALSSWWGLDGTFRLLAFASGRVIGTVTTGSGTLTVEATDSVIATAGTLASGKGGIVDQSLGTVSMTRDYDDVAVATPAPEPIVLYSGRKIEIRHDSTERESSAGGTWGRPQSYRGSRFRVPPAGDADRTTRVAAKASRNDLSTAEDANLTDQIQLTATVTPRCTVIPRV